MSHSVGPIDVFARANASIGMVNKFQLVQNSSMMKAIEAVQKSPTFKLFESPGFKSLLAAQKSAAALDHLPEMFRQTSLVTKTFPSPSQQSLWRQIERDAENRKRITQAMNHVFNKLERAVDSDYSKRNGPSPTLKMILLTSQELDQRFPLITREQPAWIREAFYKQELYGRNSEKKNGRPKELLTAVQTYLLVDVLKYLRWEELQIHGDSNEIVGRFLNHSKKTIEARVRRAKKLGLEPISNEEYWVFDTPISEFRTFLQADGWQDLTN